MEAIQCGSDERQRSHKLGKQRWTSRKGSRQAGWKAGGQSSRQERIPAVRKVERLQGSRETNRHWSRRTSREADKEKGIQTDRQSRKPNWLVEKQIMQAGKLTNRVWRQTDKGKDNLCFLKADKMAWDQLLFRIYSKDIALMIQSKQTSIHKSTSTT